MILKFLKFFVLLTLLTSSIFAQNPGSVPIISPVYPFIDRMETLGNMQYLLDGVKPLSRYRVAEILGEIAENREQLTSIDKRKLDEFLLDFRFEIDRSDKHSLISRGGSWYSTLSSVDNFKKDFWRFIDQQYPEEENHTLIWERDSSNFYLDLQQYSTYDSRSDGLYRSSNEQSFIFRGTIDNSFSYGVNISLQAVRGSTGYREYDPVIKGTFTQENETGDIIHVDRTGAELAWHTRFMDIVFAHQEISWGHGESGKLILSNYPEQYPYLQISKNWGWGRFTAMHGKLISFQVDTLNDGTYLYPDKWLAAHRLEIYPWSNFTVGLNEVFIYGNRYADWAYLIPFNFYRSVQHKLRDRDNATISLDFKYIPVAGTKLYVTIFLDEMKFEKLGTNWWGNKHAIQIGVYQLDLFGIENFELTAEYSAIMPWVYTHRFMINRYESDRRSLGHWAGPNSEVLYLNIKKEFHPRFFAGVKWMQYKKGRNTENKNIGGDLLTGRNILIGNQVQPKETRKFLEGDLLAERSSEFYLQYELFSDLYLSTSYIWTNSNEIKDTNEFHLGFLFNY